MCRLIYFSSQSGNTQRFIEKLNLNAIRLPINADTMPPTPEEPFVLICPTYADGYGRNAVPKSVIRFLNNPKNRSLLKGIIAPGNRNFGSLFAQAGDVIAQKCQVPVLYRFELAGTEQDILRVREGLKRFWLTL